MVAKNKELSALKHKREDDAEASDCETPKETPEENKVKKETASVKQLVREKLLKFIQRIPILMYVTDWKEISLVDVIRHKESELFQEVTELSPDDFETLCKIVIFNEAELNSAVFAFYKAEKSTYDDYLGRDVEREMYGGFTTVHDAEDNEVVH